MCFWEFPKKEKHLRRDKVPYLIFLPVLEMGPKKGSMDKAQQDASKRPLETDNHTTDTPGANKPKRMKRELASLLGVKDPKKLQETADKILADPKAPNAMQDLMQVLQEQAPEAAQKMNELMEDKPDRSDEVSNVLDDAARIGKVFERAAVILEGQPSSSSSSAPASAGVVPLPQVPAGAGAGAGAASLKVIVPGGAGGDEQSIAVAVPQIPVLLAQAADPDGNVRLTADLLNELKGHVAKQVEKLDGLQKGSKYAEAGKKLSWEAYKKYNEKYGKCTEMITQSDKQISGYTKYLEGQLKFGASSEDVEKTRSMLTVWKGIKAVQSEKLKEFEAEKQQFKEAWEAMNKEEKQMKQEAQLLKCDLGYLKHYQKVANQLLIGDGKRKKDLKATSEHVGTFKECVKLILKQAPEGPFEPQKKGQKGPSQEVFYRKAMEPAIGELLSHISRMKGFETDTTPDALLEALLSLIENSRYNCASGGIMAIELFNILEIGLEEAEQKKLKKKKGGEYVHLENVKNFIKNTLRRAHSLMSLAAKPLTLTAPKERRKNRASEDNAEEDKADEMDCDDLSMKIASAMDTPGLRGYAQMAQEALNTIIDLTQEPDLTLEPATGSGDQPRDDQPRDDQPRDDESRDGSDSDSDQFDESDESDDDE